MFSGWELVDSWIELFLWCCSSPLDDNDLMMMHSRDLDLDLEDIVFKLACKDHRIVRRVESSWAYFWVGNCLVTAMKEVLYFKGQYHYEYDDVSAFSLGAPVLEVYM